MSLQTLRAMRLNRERPTAVVTVFVGEKPEGFTDSPARILVLPHHTPALLDFRPLVGLWVDLVMVDDLYPLALKTIDCINAAGAKFFGASLPCGTYPCIQNPTREHHAILRQTRDLLCQ